MSISCDFCTSKILAGLVPFSAEISAPSCFAVGTSEFLLWPPPCKGEDIPAGGHCCSLTGEAECSPHAADLCYLICWGMKAFAMGH